MMKHLYLLAPLFVACCLHAARADAGPGDSVIVRTFTFNDRSPYDAKFLFPGKEKRFEKILMYYKLKCNPEQNPACGEWDYITSTNLYRPTGRIDSTLRSGQLFTVNGAYKDTLMYMNSPSWYYIPGFQRYVSSVDISSMKEYRIGTIRTSTPPEVGRGSPDARTQFLWRADELKAAGMTAGPVTGLSLSVAAPGGTIRNFTIRLKQTSRTSTNPLDPELAGFTRVFRRTLDIPFSGAAHLYFDTPFAWDGTSNILVDFSFENNPGAPFSLYADSLGWNCGLNASGKDNVLDFSTTDLVPVPTGNFSTLDTAATVMFWQYGDPGRQPLAASVFEGIDAKGNRVLNGHVPWDNGHVYWDAGNVGSSYDRIESAAQPQNYRGQWNHWAFTKSVNTGTMQIFLNGSPWFSGTGKSKSMGGIAAFNIGSNGAGNGTYYDGLLDDFSIWNIVLDTTQIRRAMYGGIPPSDPLRNRLVAGYAFDEGGVRIATLEEKTGLSSPLVGRPDWANFKGERVKNFTSLSVRPVLAFVMNGINTVDSAFVLDSVPKPQNMIVFFRDTLNPAIPTDTLYRWPAYIRYRYDSTGVVTDSTVIPPDGAYLNRKIPYYQKFEVVDRFELGRFITPYGIGLDMGEGWTWIYDVSDFRGLLADSVRISAGNWQELLELTFVFIEGTPPRDVVKIENVWNGDYPLSQFVDKVSPKTIPLDPGANMFRLKITTTGHQFSNPTNCAEFCPKIHSLDVGGVTRYQWQIVQQCDLNPLYPQGGTWIFDRAGWCPGMPCTTQDLELTPFISGSTAAIDYNCEYDDYGNYVVESQLVSYGAPNFPLDAALVDIIEPNSHELHSRYNPSCSAPRVVVRNTGSAPLTSLVIAYGPVGGNTNSYTWHGSAINFLEQREIELPPFDGGSWTGPNLFRAAISSPNGGADGYAPNNALTVPFELVPVYDKPLIVNLKTNNRASENSYEVLDASGSLVAGRSGLANSTIYRDTLRLPAGCYEFILHDAGGDGIDFWYNRSQTGSGSMVFRMAGGFLYKSLNPDFGAETRFQFRYSVATGVAEFPSRPERLSLYPNPTAGRLILDMTLEKPGSVAIRIYDLRGALVRDLPARDFAEGPQVVAVPVADLPAGEYFVALFAEGRLFERKGFQLLR